MAKKSSGKKSSGKKETFGVRKPRSVKSPTGRPSKKSSGVLKMERGDFSGGARPKKKKKVKRDDRKGINMRIEDALRRSGV